MSTDLADTVTTTINQETARTRKFLFDRSFDVPFADEKEPEKPKPIFTQEEMDQAKEESFAAGRAAGHKDALDAEVLRQSQLLTHIGENLVQAMSSAQEALQARTTHMEQVALLIARKVLPAYIEREGDAEILRIVEKIIASMAQEPRLVIRVSEGSFESAKDKIQAAAQQAAFAGQLVILSDPNFGASDCRIEWADGGVERDLKKIWEDIGHVLEADGAGLSLSFEDDAPAPLDQDVANELSEQDEIQNQTSLDDQERTQVTPGDET